MKSFGYHVEEHFVTTEDGYILSLHRIPPNLNFPPKNHRAKPVLLAHSLIGSSAVFAFGPRENSLAYILADQGKEVFHDIFYKIILN